jgi:hypothetical protein
VRTFIIKVDTTRPVAGDVENVGNTNLLASDSSAVEILARVNGGSPIVEIRGRFENWNTQNSLLSQIDSDIVGIFSQSSTLSTWITSQNVCNVTNIASDLNTAACNVTNGE